MKAISARMKLWKTTLRSSCEMTRSTSRTGLKARPRPRRWRTYGRYAGSSVLSRSSFCKCSTTWRMGHSSGSAPQSTRRLGSKTLKALTMKTDLRLDTTSTLSESRAPALSTAVERLVSNPTRVLQSGQRLRLSLTKTEL